MVAIVGAFFAIRLWNGGSWVEAVTRNPDAYPASGRLFAPWVKQYFYSVIFLAVGAFIVITLRPKDWRQALQPWLLGGVLLSVLAALGIAASPTLRVYSTSRDAHGLPMHQRLVPEKNVPMFLAEAVALGAFAMVLRRQDRRRPRE